MSVLFCVRMPTFRTSAVRKVIGALALFSVGQTAYGSPGPSGVQVTDLFRDGASQVATERDNINYDLVIHAASGKVLRVSMPRTPWNVKSFRKAAFGKFVVDLPQGNSAEEIYVISLEQPALIDRFLCYDPKLSPDGTFLAFIAWYPSHFANSAATSDFMMSYDMGKDALGNHFVRSSDFPLSAVKDRQVGRRVYPLPRAHNNGTSQQADSEPTHDISEVRWLQGSTRLLFLDETSSPPPKGTGELTSNLNVSSRLPAVVAESVVTVDFAKKTITIQKAALPSCPLISGIECNFDIKNAQVVGENVLVSVVQTGRQPRERQISIPLQPYEAP